VGPANGPGSNPLVPDLQTHHAPRDRFLTGLVGEGIGSSRSPWLHEGEADARSARLIYSLFDLAGRGIAGLKPLLDAAILTGFSGLNVTHPFKQAIIPLLDELSAEAAMIGAVNTVAFHDGRSIGYNTDCAGFAEGLRRGLTGASVRQVVQIGAGGAGAATAFALLQQGTMHLEIHDVDAAKADALAARLRENFDAQIAVVQNLRSAVQTADGIVNASPVGMVGHDGLPIPAEWLREEAWVADIIYFPLQTELLREARQIGCRTVDGIAMVVFQAAAAFEIFTGLEADRERMLARALAHWQPDKKDAPS
jgi:shikimate dehydrogenase